MTFAEFYYKFGLAEYPFNTFTTEDERKTKELFIEPVDYSLIKDAFKNSRTIIMAGNRGTGKTAIVFDLIRNAPQNSFILYIDDFSSLSEHPSIKDFYKMICEYLVNTLMSRAVEIKKGISHLPKEDKLFLSQLIVNYMTTVTYQNLNFEIEKIQLSGFSRFINKISKFIQFALNYGLSAGVKLFNSMFANQFSLPIIETNSAIGILPQVKVNVDTSFKDIDTSFSLLTRICQLIKRIGFSNVVVMVDKIDEDSRFKNDGEQISTFIKPLLTDNKLLLCPDLQIAISLWSIPFDNLKSDIRTQKFYCPVLQWHRDDLIRAFNQRVKVYSCEHTARKFHEFFADDISPEDIKQLLVLANHNPRDLWHIFNALFHKQYAIDPNASVFTKEALIGALADFVTDFNYFEYYPRKKNARRDSMDIYRYINHLLKLPDAVFTANQLNSYAGTGSSTNNFIGSMQGMGLIVRTDSKIGTGIVYQISDPKVIYAIHKGLRIARAQ
ncbi:P-loop ATPase, Sll1717 family [Bittarella massiliensis (ex Durand et al. 2017)]|uniref:ATP-binding protein n=1 Tax=Bittarella massiliensis (ex Durand et al. 2017) TaxID=1720313 RepID=A0AAW5KHL6_9FIRM|nr:hypothetical protein [Bittarella massiliensis (ex Durand et al. 2017)]MCQ4949700.1 hypothetical protein [Bittarella massiliensis (ex Durand et al. 2017)]